VKLPISGFSHATYLSHIKGRTFIELLTAFIKIVRADFERSANMPKHPLIDYPQLNLFLHKTPKNRISVLVLYYIQIFILIPLVLISSSKTVIEYRIQSTHIFIKSLFRTPGTSKRKDASKSQRRFFSRWQYLPIGKIKKIFGQVKAMKLKLEVVVIRPSTQIRGYLNARNAF